MNNLITAKAHTNIALIKYWGKKNDELIIPQNSSLSLTLDAFYTQTSVIFDESLSNDQLLINSQNANQTELSKVSNFLNIIRKMAHIDTSAKVISTNHVPTAAGLASSASAFAALAGAASKAAGLDLNKRDLSRLARRGSGSACRSIYGGFVEWQGGHNDEDSFAKPIYDEEIDINVIALATNKSQKKISSRTGMKISVDTSPYYPTWIKVANNDLVELKNAIYKKDFTKLGTISELNAMRMHALTLSANPDFLYFNGDTLNIMNEVKSLRSNGIECYYTIDAGPNVKVICKSKDSDYLVKYFNNILGNENVILAKPGNGIEFIE
ncbi:diphosphomevalonate decarboxylase [Lentilactobacillus laojiaonis]|uniref:diphosphomevalonate decarboxylase n=1 Tax=Lentilactobacillus laojiaonis TaxID=2883998 RepID=UPI001D0B2294|nr:diphosphomevalonate decarboxylase [Lentilactobacillus laojiaonis]UDM32733.1 diphosphomevalonate decarboxylase [Lentilactobacillus laojiaonis]